MDANWVDEEKPEFVRGLRIVDHQEGETYTVHSEDADNLIKIYRQVPADLVNIIEYNPIEFARFKKPTEEKTADFMRHLEKNRVNARLRKSRGKDIDAACGQLANK